MPGTFQGKAIIIGGGIGGLAAAVALRRVGMEAEVFERAPEIHEVGAGLSLWSNAVTALRRLGLEERICTRGMPVIRMRTVTATGELLNEVNIEELSRRAGAVSLGIQRADLQRTLAEALPSPVLHTSARCVGIEAGEKEVTARFADGRVATGDLLIGADGIQSIVRGQLCGPQQPRYAGYTCWRGLAGFEHPHLPAELTLIALGLGAQMGVFHCGPGRVFWFLTRNAPAGERDPHDDHKQAVQTICTRWQPPFSAVIEATQESAVLKNDIFDRPPIRTWGAGRVTLLGDAAHATTPNLGQGACQALEDAIVLADSLRQANEVSAGLRCYEARRRNRTASVIKQSWWMGKMAQLQSPAAVWLRNWSARTKWGRRQGLKEFEELLTYKVPELTRLPPGAENSSGTT